MAKKSAKLPGQHGRIYYSRGKKKNGLYFADFAPRGLGRIWTRLKVNTRHFIKEYTFAVSVTAVFLAIILLASVVRASQRSSLASLLTTVTTVSQDYSSLVSGDKYDPPESTGASDEVIARTPSGTANSTSFNFNPTSSNGGDSGGQSGSGSSGGSSGNGGSSGGGGGSGGEPNPEPEPVFAASIADYQLLNPDGEMICPGIKITNNNCDKTYNFTSKVSTQYGPGTVNYGWTTSFSGGSSTGSYTASSGTDSQTLSKSITIRCRDSGNYTMQFSLSSPNSVQSNVITINHSC